jgi:hypothetical protein
MKIKGIWCIYLGFLKNIKNSNKNEFRLNFVIQ